MTRPLLATSTDGVGTKVAIAQALDKHDTIGFDLVGMVVDDIVVCGAEPLFMTDYIACGKVVPERIAAIVRASPRRCAEAGMRPRRRRDRRAPRPARARRVRRRRRGHRRRRGRRPARPASGRGPATSSSRWRPAACTPTATRSSAASSRPAGWSARPPRRRVRADARRGAARADPALRAAGPRPRPSPDGTSTRSATSPVAGSPPTSRGCCPPGTLATLDRSTWTPPPVFGTGPAPRPGTPDRPRTHPQPRGRHPRGPARRPGRPRRRARGERRHTRLGTRRGRPPSTEQPPPQRWSAAPRASTEERSRCSASTRTPEGSHDRKALALSGGPLPVLAVTVVVVLDGVRLRLVPRG